jgi:hypothetical protein
MTVAKHQRAPDEPASVESDDSSSSQQRVSLERVGLVYVPFEQRARARHGAPRARMYPFAVVSRHSGQDGCAIGAIRSSSKGAA